MGFRLRASTPVGYEKAMYTTPSQVELLLQRLDLALEAGKMGVWDWEVATDRLTWSDELQKLFGLEPGTFRGTYEHYQELLHPLDRDQVLTTVQKAIAERQPYSVEHRVPLADGSFRWLLGKGQPFYDQNGQLLRMSGVTLDITERRLAELEYRKIFDLPTNLIVIVGPDTRFQKVNPAMKAIMGFDPEFMVGRSITEFIHPDDLPATFQAIGRLFGGEPVVADFRIRSRHADGSYRCISWSGSSMDDKIYAIGTDVTSQLRAEAALNEAVRVRDEFISLASHELKTPLTSMQLQAQIADRELKRGNLAYFTPGKTTKLLATFQQQIERLTHLVEDMLDVSRISQRSLRVEKVEMELGALVADVVEKLRGQLEAQGSRVSLELDAGVRGSWDPFRIEQVIVNLLTNAAKYGNHKPVQVRLGQEGGLALLRVRDEGVGIAPEHQKRIFERFERASADRGITGLGLGLYITKHIVEVHGGEISVESRVGEGSTFTVKLPV